MNIVEYGRKLSIESLFNTNVFSNSFNFWKNRIQNILKNNNPRNYLDLGESLSDIFKSTSPDIRSQSSVSGAGSSWEALICWYLNLVLMGQNTIVMKQNKKLIPSIISDAISVNYGSFISNTEADLIAITFPKKREFEIDISSYDREGKFQYLEVINNLVEKYFGEISIHIIQCKTNWNDNAQIPMLWNMVYSSSNLINSGHSSLSVGRNGFSLSNCKKFTYSFVTVPTVELSKFKIDSVAVQRVANMSGGNYWGYPTKSGIARNIKEMIFSNFNDNLDFNPLKTLENYIPLLKTEYNYFRLF
jgi:hypothetical protein